MSDPSIIVADRDKLRSALADIIRDAILEHVPTAIREAQKAKWLHRDTVKDRYGLTDRQLQYLRDKRKVSYTQRRRRIWYLRESIEDYFEAGRVDSNQHPK